MMYGIYSIYDVAMKAYAQPFYQINDDVAKRSFKMAINNPTAENLYPVRDDLELWCIGYFDDRCGMIIYDQNDKLGLGAKYPCRIVSRGEAVLKPQTMKEEEESSDDL